MKSGNLFSQLRDKFDEKFKTKRYKNKLLCNFLMSNCVNEDMSSMAHTVQNNTTTSKSEGISFGQAMNNCINYQ